MTVSEQSRHALFLALESVLGEEVALTLMEHLPPVGWADVATKRDLDQLHTLTQRDVALLGAELRTEIGQLGTELRGEISQLGTDLRTEIGQLGTELRGEISQLGTELRGEISQLGTDLRREMYDGMAAQTRTLVFTVLGSMATMSAVTLSAARFG